MIKKEELGSRLCKYVNSQLLLARKFYVQRNMKVKMMKKEWKETHLLQNWEGEGSSCETKPFIHKSNIMHRCVFGRKRTATRRFANIFGRVKLARWSQATSCSIIAGTTRSSRLALRVHRVLRNERLAVFVKTMNCLEVRKRRPAPNVVSIPHAHCTISRSTRNESHIWRNSDRIYGCSVTIKNHNTICSSKIPDNYALVLASGDKVPPARRKRQRGDASRVTAHNSRALTS
mmetsp:Transcript_15294/g.29646  ORF Transcript_15294/g.29646 Transcript_15294/m.29646 type:complete len:232 (-) Transcript_15294:1366-2061(-)